MSEEFHKVINERFETEGVDIGRHKNDALAETIAEEMDTVPSWIREDFLSTKTNPQVQEALKKEAINDLASTLKDEPVQEAMTDLEDGAFEDSDKVKKSQFADAYREVSQRVIKEHGILYDKASDMAKAAHAAKNISKNSSK